jgi:hypothetical protein
MTKAEAIHRITGALETLPEERVRALAELIASWTTASAFSSLTIEQRQELDDAVDSLDRKDVMSFEDMRSALDQRLRANGA